MGIVGGNDERRVIRPNEPEFTIFPLPAVTAIDTYFNVPSNPYNSYGSGIVIAPNYVLTASHVVRDYDANKNATKIRVTTSANATPDKLISRIIGNSPTNVNTNSGIYYPFGSGNNRKVDVALLKTDNPLLDAKDVVGLIAFLEPERNGAAIKGRFPIQTAGYPADNIPNVTTANGINNHTKLQHRDLALAPGSFDSFGNINNVFYDRRISYTKNIDTYKGQSGSGIWHTLDGDTKPRILGIHNYNASGGGISAFNGGIIFDTEFYYKITEQIKNGQGIDGKYLPENAIIGTDPSFFDPDLPPLLSGGNDEIFGTYRKERILGNKGNDKLFGGGADDRLEGGEGKDQALFSEIFTNYDWTILDPTNPAFEFNHTRGSKIDAKDTTKEIEFGVFEFADADGDNNDDDGKLFYVPLQIDPNHPSKLKDGPLIHPTKDILDSEGEEIATMTVESPAWMFDGDVEYTLNIGIEEGQLFNIAYIIDTSGSMVYSLEQTKNAFIQLTELLVNDGYAFTSEFAVINFNSTASTAAPLGAIDVIPVINGLQAGGGTNFNDPLSQAINYFSSPLRIQNAIDLAYFVSDGIPNSTPYVANANSLKQLADVRAFGIGNANLATLNPIDSDGNAVLLSSAGDL